MLPVLFAKVPPAPPSLHTALVAPPPNDPPKVAVVLPGQMAAVAEPALTVGFGFVTSVKIVVTGPLQPAALAVMVVVPYQPAA